MYRENNPTIEQYEAAMRRQMIYTNELHKRLLRAKRDLARAKAERDALVWERVKVVYASDH